MIKNNYKLMYILDILTEIVLFGILINILPSTTQSFINRRFVLILFIIMHLIHIAIRAYHKYDIDFIEGCQAYSYQKPLFAFKTAITVVLLIGFICYSLIIRQSMLR